MPAETACPAKRPPTIYPLRSLTHLRTISRGWLAFLESLPGLGDVIEWSIGPMRETWVFHPDDIAEVLAAIGANGPLGRPSTGVFPEREAIIGNKGLVMSDGPLWKRQRRILQPGMRRQRIAEYARTMVQSAEELADQWADGGTLAMQDQSQRLTRLIMTRTLFGGQVTDIESDELKRVMDRQLLYNSIEFVMGSWLPPQVPTPLRAGLRNSSNRLRTMFDAVIHRRRCEAAGLRHTRDTDLLDMLLDARDDDGCPLSRNQLGDEMHNMFLGGYETSANTLAFIAAALARHPEIQQRAADEVAQALGKNPVTFELLQNLPLIEAIVRETLRLYPPVFGLPTHVVKEPTTLAGYDFTPGEHIVVSPYVTQRDPRWYPEPLEFRPDRWLDGSTDDAPRFAWIPFGGGPRVCYGQQFAMAELVLSLTVLLRRFRFDLPANASEKIATKFTGTAMLRLKNDEVVVQRRA